MRNTKQKEYVLQNLKNRHDHPTAKQIADSAKAENVSIGTTTVYRILHSLTENGLAKKIITKDNVTHFDYAREDHIHIICNSCGAIADLPAEQIFKDDISLPKGFTICLQDIILYGTCKNCQNATPVAKYQNK